MNNKLNLVGLFALLFTILATTYGLTSNITVKIPHLRLVMNLVQLQEFQPLEEI
jgi:hypothetical protein